MENRHITPKAMLLHITKIGHDEGLDAVNTETLCGKLVVKLWLKEKMNCGLRWA